MDPKLNEEKGHENNDDCNADLIQFVNKDVCEQPPFKKKYHLNSWKVTSNKGTFLILQNSHVPTAI